MNGWQQRDNTLVRELQLRDFDEALGFVQQLAARAQDYGRRPDVSIEAGRVTLWIANRHNAGITAAERRLAAKVDAVIDAR